MDLRVEKVTSRLPEYARVCALLRSAFPAAEQISPWLLRLLARKKGNRFLAFYDGDTFCGSAYTVENEKYIFLLYIAVPEELRSKGCGSRILERLRQGEERILVLNAEALDPAAANAEQREKRVRFYRKNGITDTGFRFRDGEVTYSVLASDPKRLNVQEYAALVKRFSFGTYRMKMEK